MDEGQQIAQLKKKPFAIYFASKDEVKIVGENADAIKQYAAANGNTLPTTVFELPKVIDQFRSMGVVEFVKAANDKENRDLVAKYGGANSTLVIVAPDGSKIGIFGVLNGNLNSMVAIAKTTIEAWRNQQPAEPEKKP
ncbi:MAG: hypothetical protein WCT04_25245 [Planctomycetota bacterium]